MRPTLTIAATLLLGSAALAQQPLDDELAELGIRIDEHVSVEYVLVPVVVRGKKRLLYDLKPKQFDLRVDGRPVAIETFEQGSSAPLSLVVMHDLSGSMAHLGKMDAGLRAIDYFLNRLRPADEVALATFTGGRTIVEVPFTSDRSVLRESIALWEAWGTTALYDAVANLPEISLEGQEGTRAALLVTDGVDNASELDPDQARALVERAELPVYVLGLESYKRPDDQVFRYRDLLRLLAEGTGGQYYSVTSQEEAQAASAAILTELRHQYVLGFQVSGYGENRYRRIDVDVKKRRAEPVHRGGYRGTAPTAWND